jgi:hypothetical protein
MKEKEIVKKLNDKIIQYKYDLLQFKKIFWGDSQEYRNYLIKESSIDFFRHINGLFWDRLVLSISKLTDKYEAGSNKNISIDYVIYLAEKKKMNCSEKIKVLYGQCFSEVKHIRKYRSKFVAHQDFNSAFKSDLSVNIGDVEKAFSKIENIMNIFHLEYEGVQWSFNLDGYKDANSLMYFIEQALIYEYFKEKRNDYEKDMIEEIEFKRSIKY